VLELAPESGRVRLDEASAAWLTSACGGAAEARAALKAYVLQELAGKG
jgi:hypothetical protein